MSKRHRKCMDCGKEFSCNWTRGEGGICSGNTPCRCEECYFETYGEPLDVCDISYIRNPSYKSINVNNG